MKLILLAALLTTVQPENFDNLLWLNRRLPPPGRRNDSAVDPCWKIFEQKLDHFDENDNKVLKMRYLMNDQFYDEEGPAFVMLGGETEIDPGWLMSGQMYDMAAEHQAVMYYLEHRYYGDSKPLRTISFDMMDYPFLSSKQALADYAAFIRRIKKNIRVPKVVVFGGSYGGNLAVWMRYKYPELVFAAVVSSAPVEAQVDFKEYMEFIPKLLYSRKCLNVIECGLKSINRYLYSGPIGREKVKNDLNTVNIYNKYDWAFLYASIASEIINTIQYSKQDNMVSTCRELLNSTQTNHYVKLTQFIKRRRSTSCIENYNQFIHFFSSYSTYIYRSYRQWLFQACNEFGFFQSSSSPFEPFYNYFPVDLTYKLCFDLFGLSPDRIKKGVKATNNEYHGSNISVSRVLAVYGDNDPWTVLGLKPGKREVPVIRVPGGTHCEDMYSLSPDDSLEMAKTKERVKYYVDRWLSKY